MADWDNLEERWREFFASEKCPPVIGLAPLSDAEVEEITRLVAVVPAVCSAQSRFAGLLRLIELYPAAMAVWLARRAGEAYNENFWLNFEQVTGFGIPVLKRSEFVAAFSRACSQVMSNFVAPPEGWIGEYVRTCLFHAGLPLCHCGTFSEAVRWAERHVGLPSLDEPQAGELLREEALRFPQLANVPILRSALTGPAGAMICDAALRVVFEQDYGAINPRLGRALADAFANVRPEQLRRSARPPFLRIGADLTSFEIVGPRQPPGVTGGSGIIWRIADQPHRVSLAEELVFPVQPAAERVKVEVRGLTEGRTLNREFVFDWSLREMPVFAFERQSRKERSVEPGEAVMLRPGDYLIVHPSDLELEGGELIAHWPDSLNATSAVALRPGLEARLGAEKQIVFQATQTPFLDLTGSCVHTDDLQRIHFGWKTLPEIWCPSEAHSDIWTLRVSCGAAEHSWTLRPGDFQERMRRFAVPDSDEFLRTLAPGIWRLRFVASRAGRRPEFDEMLWFWNGLESWREGVIFELSALPQNVSREHSAGFAFEPSAIRHRSDGAREHVLGFFVPGREGDELHRFRWTRAGLFLESFERCVGAAIQPQSHAIPYTFSASVDSTRYLRIWLVPPDNAELVVNGQVFEQMNERAQRSFVELSLATLSTHHAQGRIVLRRHGIEQPLAFFTRPLVPRIIDLQSDADYVTLVCKFEEAVDWVRPRARDLITGAARECEGRQFDTSGHALFPCDNLPAIECANIATDPLGVAGNDFRVSLDAPRKGWPSGVWMIEMEVRRDVTSGWQPLQDAHGGCLCLVHAVPPEAAPADFRSGALWWAFGQTWHGTHIPEELPHADGSADALCELLDETTALLARGFNEHSWSRLRVLETLHSRLGREAARLMNAGDERLAARLLESAARETNPKRSLFIAIPELLALDAQSYSALPPMNPLLESLHWCGELALHRHTADALKPAIDDFIDQARLNPYRPPPGLIRVLQLFRQQPNPNKGLDFARFDLAGYWQRIIGTITDGDREHAGSLDLVPEEYLGREQVLGALGKWWQRRESGQGGSGLNEAHSVFVSARAFSHWLNQQIATHWFEPWVRVELDEDALTVEACQFISVFALACRAVAAGWLPFQDVLNWLHERHPASAIGKTFTTFVALGPELFGYYLMLWELIIRTTPHD